MMRDVQAADLHMLSVEARRLLGVIDFAAAGWQWWVEPNDSLPVYCWHPERAKVEFLNRYRELVGP